MIAVRSAVAVIVLVLFGMALLGLGLNAIINPSCMYQFVRVCPGFGDYLVSLALDVPGALLIAAGLIAHQRAKTG
jgi:hypothetical protein